MIEAEIGEKKPKEGEKNEIIVEMSEMCLRACLHFLSSPLSLELDQGRIQPLSMLLLYACECQF
jgi:hypothetical protein